MSLAAPGLPLPMCFPDAADGQHPKAGGCLGSGAGGAITFGIGAEADQSPHTPVRSLLSALVDTRCAPAIQGFQPSGAWEAAAELTLRAKGSAHGEGLLLRLTAGRAADGACTMFTKGVKG